MKLQTELSDFKTLDHGSSQRSAHPQTKRARSASQRIPKWAYLLFILLAGFVTYRILQHRASEVKAAQPAPRPASVAKVITKDVPLYLDEIGTCAAYETVQVQAQVSGVIMERHFQDGSDVKKGDLLFTIDPRPYRADLTRAEGTVAQYDARVHRAEHDYRRVKSLLAGGAVGQAAVEHRDQGVHDGAAVAGIEGDDRNVVGHIECPPDIVERVAEHAVK